MRDYLYLWRNEAHGYLLTSGIEFADLAPVLSESGGIILLQHDHDDVVSGPRKLDFVFPHEIDALSCDDIDSYGNFIWVDCAPCAAQHDAPEISDADLAALLYLGHTGEPLSGNIINSVGNRFLGVGHDDGWRLKLYYSSWFDVETLLKPLVERFLSSNDAASLINGVSKAESGYWVTNGRVEEVTMTEDIDGLMNECTR